MEYEFYVTGMKFHQYLKIKHLIKEGDKILIALNPENQYDPNAVKVIYPVKNEFIMLGHVPMKKDLSLKISRHIKEIINDPDYPGDPFWIGIVTYHSLESPSYKALKVKVTFDE